MSRQTNRMAFSLALLLSLSTLSCISEARSQDSNQASNQTSPPKENTYKIKTVTCNQKRGWAPNWNNTRCCCQGNMFCRTPARPSGDPKSLNLGPLRFYDTPRPLPEWVVETCKDTSKPCRLAPREVHREMEQRGAVIQDKCIETGKTSSFTHHFRGCLNSDGYLTFFTFTKIKTSPLSHCVASRLVETPYPASHFGASNEIRGSVSYDDSTGVLTFTSHNHQDSSGMYRP